MAPINAIYLALYRIRTFLSSSGNSKKAYTHVEVDGNSLSIGHAEMEKEIQKTVKEVNRENMS
jgi:hypothetical protein